MSWVDLLALGGIGGLIALGVFEGRSLIPSAAPMSQAECRRAQRLVSCRHKELRDLLEELQKAGVTGPLLARGEALIASCETILCREELFQGEVSCLFDAVANFTEEAHRAVTLH